MTMFYFQRQNAKYFVTIKYRHLSHDIHMSRINKSKNELQLSMLKTDVQWLRKIMQRKMSKMDDWACNTKDKIRAVPIQWIIVNTSTNQQVLMNCNSKQHAMVVRWKMASAPPSVFSRVCRVAPNSQIGTNNTILECIELILVALRESSWASAHARTTSLHTHSTHNYAYSTLPGCSDFPQMSR